MADEVERHIHSGVKLSLGFDPVQTHAPGKHWGTRVLLYAWCQKRAPVEFSERFEGSLNLFADTERVRPNNFIVHALNGDGAQCFQSTGCCSIPGQSGHRSILRLIGRAER